MTTEIFFKASSMVAGARSAFFRLSLMAVVFCVMMGRAEAGTITSAQTGTWATGSTWVGGVAPASTDTVIIAAGHTVTLGAATTCGALHILGTLTITSAKTLNVNGGGTSPVTYGTISGNGTIAGTGALTMNVKGSFTFSGTISNLDTRLEATGTGNQNINGVYATSGTISLLTINKSSGIFLLTSNLSTSGNLVFTAGTLDPASYKITIGGATFSLAASAKLFVNAGSFSDNFSKIPSSLNASSIIEYTNALATINSSIAYTNLIYSGSGTATLSAATTVSAILTVNSGSTIDMGGFALTPDRFSGSGTVTSSSGSPVFTIGGDNGTYDVSATLAGSLALTKVGTGTLTLSGNNTYSGVTNINAGIIKLGSTSALGSTSGGTVIASGSSLDLNGFNYTAAEPLSVAGTGVGGNGSIRNSSASAGAFGGAIALTAATTFTCDAGEINLTGNISGAFNLTINGTGAGGSISGNINTGVGTLTKADAGTWSLSGNSSFSGSVSISLGTLVFSSLANSGSNSSLGSGSSISMSATTNGCTLKYIGSGHSSDRAIALSGAGGGGVTLDASGTGKLTLSGGISGSGAPLFFTGTGEAEQSGVINNGSAKITKNGTGTWIFSGTNTFLGIIVFNAGILSVPNITNGSVAGSLGAASNAATNLDFNGGTLRYTGASASTDRLFTFATNTTSTINVESNSTVLTLSNTGANPASGTGNTGSFIKSGAGVLLLSGGNGGYNGNISIQEGTLRIGANNSLGSTSGSTTVSANGVLDLNGITYSTAEALTINGTGISGGGAVVNSSATAATFAGAVTLGSTSSIITNAGDLTISGSISGNTLGLTIGGSGNGTISGVIGTSSGTLTKTGSGTWTVSASNTYTGLTTISAGILKLGAAGGATNTPLGTTLSGTTINSGGCLDLNGFTLGTAEALTISGNGVSSGGALINSSASAVTYSGLITLGASSSIIANNGGITISNAGTITGSGFDLTLSGSIGGTLTSILGTGTGGLIKEGSGTWVLGGVSTYTGSTTVTAGILRINAAERINNSSGLVLNGGTFSTGASGGFSETFNTLTLSANSTIAFGTGVHTITFSASNATSWTAATQLTISGWTGSFNGTSGTAGKIFIGSNTSGLTAGQLSQIRFYDGSNYFPGIFLSDGEFVATAEAISNLSYSPASNVYTAGVAISNWVPTITGTPTSYGISPGLPAGLSISAVTGVISGTPTAAITATTFTVTASNPTSSITFDISITVNPAEATQLAFSTVSTQAAGTPFSVTVNSQDQYGNAANVTTNSNVSVSLASGDSILYGTLNGTITSGSSSVVLTGLTYFKAQNISLSVIQLSGSPNLSPGTSNTFAVSDAGVDTFVVEDAAGGDIGPQGTGLAFNIKITAYDVYNNIASSFSGGSNTVTITSTGTLASGGGATAAFSNGIISSHAVTVSNTGVFTITATRTSGGIQSGTSNEFQVGNLRFAVANGNWNATTTWSTSSIGTSGASVPVAGDIVYIAEPGVNAARTVTIPSGYSAACEKIFLGNNLGNQRDGTVIFAAASSSLTVGSLARINRPGGTATSAFTINAGTMTVNGDLELAYRQGQISSTSTARLCKVTISTGSLTVAGNINLNSENTTGVQAHLEFTGAGTLNVGGVINFSTHGLLTASTGTVNFNGTAAQTIPIGTANFNYYNLAVNNTNASGATLGGAVTAANVTNNITVGNGSNASLLNTNNLAVTLGASKTFTVAASSTLDAGTSTITFGTSGTMTVNGTVKTADVDGFSGSATTTVSSTNTPTITLGSSSTIEYTSNSTQAITARDYVNLTSSGSGARTLPDGGTVGITGIFTPGTNVYTITGNTIDFKGTGAQTIPAFNYNNLTSSSSGARTLASSGTIGVAGAFTPGSNSYTISGSTVDFNSSGDQTIPAFNFNNLTVSSGSRTLTLPSGTIGIAGTFNPGSNSWSDVSGTTFNYNGSSAQNVASFTYQNITFSDAGTKTLPSSMTVNGTWTNNGTVNAPSGTVSFSGSSAQSITGSAATTFNNLTLNNSSGLSLGGSVNATVNGILAFSSGKIVTNSNRLVLGATATTASVNSAKYINGNIRKYVADGSDINFILPIGSSTNYTPIAIEFSGTTSGSGYVDASQQSLSSAPPAASGLSQTKYINRKWILSNNGVAGFSTFSADFYFVSGDIAGAANTNLLVVRRLESSTWYTTTTGTRTSVSTKATGLTSFGEFYIGEPGLVPTITTQPASDSICTGSNKTFTAAATSDASLQAQWQRSADGGNNWTEITSGLDASTTYSGFTDNALTLIGSSTDLSGYRYRVVYTNINGSTNSNSALLYVAGTPTASAAGDDQTGIATCGLTSVTLEGNAPTTGSGLWTVVSGSGGSFSSASSASSTFSGTSGNSYTLRWTIADWPCESSFDDVVISLSSIPTLATDTAESVCDVVSVQLADGVTSSTSGLPVNYYDDRTLSNSLGSSVVTSGGMYYVKVTNNTTGCTKSDSIYALMRTSPVLSTDDSIPGECGVSSVDLNEAITSGMSGLTATFFSDRDLTSSIGANVFSTGKYYIKVTNNVACYDYDSTKIEIRPRPAAPDTVRGNRDACPIKKSSTLPDGISAIYSFTKTADAIGYDWQLPENVISVSRPFQGTVNDTILTLKYDTAYYFTDSIIVRSLATNGCYSLPYYVEVDVNYVEWPYRGSIQGPANVCNFLNIDTAIMYTVYQREYATSVIWLPPAGATVVSGQGNDTCFIIFESTFTGGDLLVAFNCNCNTSLFRPYALRASAPSLPSVISGTVNVCGFAGTGTPVTYSVTPAYDVLRFRWTLPPNVTIQSANSDSSVINVLFGASFALNTNKVLYVQGISGCGISSARSLTLSTTRPLAPSVIYGPTNACNYINIADTATYYFFPVSNAVGYIWSVPAGAAIVGRPGAGGSGDTLIRVVFDNSFVNGTSISVRSRSSCDTSTTRTFAIYRRLPAVPTAIFGSTNACPNMVSSTNSSGTPMTYYIRKVAGAFSYNWTIPANATKTHPNGSGVNDTLIHVTFGTAFTSGSIGVSSGNGCGYGSARTLSITRLLPLAPVSISGPTNACPLMESGGNPGGDTAVYSISATANSTSYIWTLPTGARFVGGTSTTGTSVSVIFSSSFISGNISVAAVNNCAVSAVRTLAVSRLLPVQPVSISGPTNACTLMETGPNVGGTPGVYSITATANATSYRWTLPSGARFANSDTTGVSVSVIFSSSFTSGNIGVAAVNNCAVSAVRTLAVSRLLPVQPVSISGTTNACPLMVSSSNPSGTPTTYTIRRAANATSYTWSVPSGASIESRPGGQGTENDTAIVVIFGSSFTSGNISVIANNNCASSTARTLAVSRLLPSTPGAISGPTNACPWMESSANPGGDTAVYSIAPTANALNYTWTLPSGARFVSNTSVIGTTIYVIFSGSFTSGSISVIANNNCASSTARTLAVSRLLPSTPGAISGPTNACPWIESATNPGGDTAVYSIAAAANATSYLWTLPSGARLVGGTTNTGTSVQVIFGSGFTSGNISVSSVNNCFVSAARTLAVSRLLPAQPGTISGPTNACPWMESPTNPGGDTAVYSLAATANATSYTWTLPVVGARFVANTSTTGTSVSVIFESSFTSGSISVVANNNCASSAARTLAVSRLLPGQPGTITATTLAGCPNRRFSYSIAATPANATSLSWTVPFGAAIDSTTNAGRTIWVTYTATGSNITGNVSVTAVNNCASSTPRTLAVTVLACAPPPPQSLISTTPPVVLNNQTISNQEQEGADDEFSVTVFPNPSTDKFNVKISSLSSTPADVRIYDIQGRPVEKRSRVQSGNNLLIGGEYKPGIYYMEVVKGRLRKIVKIIKQ